MINFEAEMPKDCWDCPCLDREWNCCNLVAERKWITKKDGRPDNCPLKEVPEDKTEELIDLIQKYINDMDRELAVIKVCEASKAKRAYFEGQRLGYIRSQEAIINKQLKEILENRLKEQKNGRK